VRTAFRRPVLTAAEVRHGLAGAVFLLLSLGGCAQRSPAPFPPATQLQDVSFTHYSPLSRNEEIARRTLTPLTFRHGQRILDARGQAFAEQPIDLTKERFAVYVPAGAPPESGYGLLVFVAPWKQATQPRRWRPAVDRHHLILVSAANSGNEGKILERRLPLALLAYENVRARYPIDPKRVYVGGLSGGSRVAQMAALAYPDVFRGVLLNAGSEPIDGERGIYLPPADLFRRFQESRIVYVTGAEDTGNLEDDQVSQASLKEWCVFNVEVQIAQRLGHEALDPSSLDRALDALDQPFTGDPAALERCNAGIQRELQAKLADAGSTRGECWTRGRRPAPAVATSRLSGPPGTQRLARRVWNRALVTSPIGSRPIAH
jgi:pimeloyl-ACP methyl ester carboxylesterase/predicted small lipoprotein YifL